MTYFKNTIYKKYLIYTVIIGLIGFGFYKKVYIPKHTFKTIHPSSGDMAVKVNGVGNIGAKEIYKIGSVYGGKVLAFTINEGDLIKKGDLVAKIDSIDLNDKILEQEANIDKLQSDIKALKIDKQSAIALYEYHKGVFEKNEVLFKKNSITEHDFKKLKTDRDIAQFSINSLSSKIDSFYSQIVQIDANTKGLKERLARYTILAPVDGYVTKKLIANFAIINANQTLIEIVQPKDVWVETHIDTRISGNVKVGDLAVIKLRSSNIKYRGKVANIKPVNNSVTNEREIDVSFDNLPLPFYLEEQAIVDIKIKQLKNILKVPTSALTFYKQKDGVWIVKEGVVTFKALKILAYNNKSAATQELTANDTLVIPDPRKKSLSNGMKILQ